MANLERGQEPFSSDSRYSYDVFLSFRGEDTRKTFTDHLYTALVQAGIHTFRDDDEIERGEYIKSELVNAIQQSRCSIIVFSKDYASSSWCLDELVMIIAHKKKSKSKHVVLPVFYDVDPSNIRKQSGSVKASFAKYEEQIKGERDQDKVKEWMDKVKGWRSALTEAADLAGMVLQNQVDGKESKFIQKVVKVIGEKLSRTVLHVGQHLVGIRARAKKINKWLEDGSIDVRVIGICGMGGIGKTTIAKFVYNQNFERFVCSSFLANIREMSQQPNGLVCLQNQLLSDIIKTKTEKINGVDEGIIKIKNAISCKRILLVLDDVDQFDQLNAILGMRDWFFPGSKIIITTRHEWLLNPHEVDKVHKVEKFIDDEAIKLFSLHAFGREYPTEGFMKHSIKAVHHCGGLPLALQVLGSSLSGKNVDVWVSALDKLEVIPDSEILKKLKVSYDSLQDDHDKNLFLHIACFFVGEDKDCIIKILDECDFFTTVGIQNLIDRCLLAIESGDKLMMHQLLRDMGREIVRQESPADPGKRSRLWFHKESFNVLKDKTGTESIEGFTLDMQMLNRDKPVGTIPRVNQAKRSFPEAFLDNSSHQDNPQKRRRFSFFSWFPGEMTFRDSKNLDLEIDAFARMQKLRLLQLSHVQLTGYYKDFPKRLRWLCWRGFSLKAIPRNFPLESIVSLDMQYSSLKQVWQGTRFLGSLKILNLSYSEGLARTPDFSGVPKLEKLTLKGCISLVEVCESIGFVEGLALLDVEDCKNLKMLPRNICRLKCLETLIISGCLNLIGFPIMELRNMESLKMLHADGISINSLITKGAELESRNAITWSWISKRRTYPDISRASLPHCLVNLHLVGCNLRDDSFPLDFSNLSLLEKLDLSGNPIQSLPDCIKNLGLYSIALNSCTMLQSLVDLPDTVKFLELQDNTSLEIVTPRSGFSLLGINHANCHKLVEIEGYFELKPIAKVDREVIDNMGLLDTELLGNMVLCLHDGLSSYHERRPIQGLHEFGIFSTFVPRGEVPSWFTQTKVIGPSISFMVPPNVRIKCLNICSMYRYSEEIEVTWFPHPAFTKINNKTKDLTWIYCPLYFGIPEYDNEDLAWLSQWKLQNHQLGGGDEVTVTIALGNGFQVKECGVKLVYHEEEEEEEEKEEDEAEGKKEKKMEEEDEEWGVLGGDLSGFQLSTGEYFLCRQKFASRSSEDWTTTDWSQNIFGDSIDLKGERVELDGSKHVAVTYTGKSKLGAEIAKHLFLEVCCVRSYEKIKLAISLCQLLSRLGRILASHRVAAIRMVSRAYVYRFGDYSPCPRL